MMNKRLIKYFDSLSTFNNIFSCSWAADLFPTWYHCTVCLLSIHKVSSFWYASLFVTLALAIAMVSVGSLLAEHVDMVKELWQMTNKTDHQLWLPNNWKYCKTDMSLPCFTSESHLHTPNTVKILTFWGTWSVGFKVWRMTFWWIRIYWSVKFLNFCSIKFPAIGIYLLFNCACCQMFIKNNVYAMHQLYWLITASKCASPFV